MPDTNDPPQGLSWENPPQGWYLELNETRRQQTITPTRGSGAGPLSQHFIRPLFISSRPPLFGSFSCSHLNCWSSSPFRSSAFSSCFFFLHFRCVFLLPTFTPNSCSSFSSFPVTLSIACLIPLLLKTLSPRYYPLLHLPSSVHLFFPLLSPSSLSLVAYFWLLLAGQMFTPSAVENPQSALLSLTSSSFICTSLLSSTVPIVSLISGVLLALARWSNVYSLCCWKPSVRVIIPCFIFLHLYISSFLYCPHRLSH